MSKKKVDTEGDSSRFDIQIGFIRRWDYFTTESVDQMSGHPMVGRVYRLIKDPIGYRLHIGRENNEIGLDGLFLGKSLIAERPDFAFDIEVVTPENYLNLPLSNEDAEQVIKWILEDNKDLWENLKKEEEGTATAAIGKLADVLKLRQQNTISVPYQGQKERAAQTSMEIMIHFKNKSTTELLQLFDGMYDRLLKIQL
jgi:hypothetical protein